MHSYDNSGSSKRKENNWKLLATFLYNEESMNIVEKADFETIQKGDFDQLVKFMRKIYSVLTKRV